MVERVDKEEGLILAREEFKRAEEELKAARVLHDSRLCYVRTGEIDISAGKVVGRLMKQREESDHYPEAVFTEEESADAIRQSETFLDAVKKYLPT